MSSGPSGSQQICVGSQHSVPQHVDGEAHALPSIVHGVGWHDPLQNGVAPWQTMPQPPQLWGSLPV
jgi:hypothetical protein